MKKILITGGSGMIGRAVTLLLQQKGYEVAWLSRHPKKQKQKSFSWDIDKHTLDKEALQWCDGIIHLAGAGVADKRWTDKRKQEILESRTQSSRLLFETIQRQDKRPEVFISASAVGYYGFNTGGELIHEEHPVGTDFLAEVVSKWEEEVLKIQALGVRTVLFRTGTVLDKKGGALPEMLKPPVAAPLGSGGQYMSWIHLQDLACLYEFALSHPLTGIYNAVAPHPVTNKQLTQLAAKEKGKPFLPLPVPGLVLKLVLGEMAQMVIGGSKISSEKIEKEGFTFRFPFIKEALEDIYK
jgi:uncharacterized protein (TIGR01777 family)